MFYDIGYLWLWLVLVLLIGVAVGMNTSPPDWSAPIPDSRIKQALIALVVAAIIAWLHIFAGVFAFWWETAVDFAAAYLIGGVIGGRLPKRSVTAS